MPPSDRAPPGAEDGLYGEALLEFVQVGSAIKVIALDPVTMTEVSIVGDPRENREVLERTALRKLAYVLNKKAPRQNVKARKSGAVDTKV